MSTMLELGGYGLPREAVAELGHRFMPKTSLDHKPFDIRLLPGTGESALLAEAVEGRVFAASFGDSPEFRRDLWQRYAARSFSITGFAWDDAAPDPYDPSGTMRIVRGTKSDDFKTVSFLRQCWGDEPLRALAAYQLDWTRTWDVATLAVDPATRRMAPGHLLVVALLHTLYRLVHANDIGWLFGVLDERVYEELDRVGVGLMPLGESMHFRGEAAKPFLLIVARLPETLQSRPDFAELLCHGRTLRGFRLDEVFTFPAELNVPA